MAEKNVQPGPAEVAAPEDLVTLRQWANERRIHAAHVNFMVESQGLKRDEKRRPSDFDRSLDATRKARI